MKFAATLVLAALVSSTEATSLNSLRRHHHHPHSMELVATLPDVRPETPTEEDIAAHEAARAEAAKFKKNPQAATLAEMAADLDAINTDMSFGVSFSQRKRNDHAREVCTKVATSIKNYASNLIGKINTAAEGTLTEQNAHNIAAVIFYDVQLEDAMKGLGMAEDADLVLAVNRLKSLQKLYLFEQKGGEDYLGAVAAQ